VKRRVAFTPGLAAIVLVVLATCLGACASGPGGSSTGDDETPVRGGILRVAFREEPASLDPAVAWDVVSWSVERLTYETLLTYANRPGEEGARLTPGLAREVPSAANGGISPDGRTYTFKLRRGVRFPSPVDREMTAGDLVWSFERMMAEPRAPAKAFYTGIAGAWDYLDGAAEHIRGLEAVDDSTVRITLKRPDGAFLHAMALPFTSVMPGEWVRKVDSAIDRRPLGTGPFVIKSWRPGTEIIARRNRGYWDPGKPYLDEIVVDVGVEPETAVRRVRRHSLDVMGDALPEADVARLADDPVWSAYVDDAPQIASVYLFMNVRESPWDDVRVRRAVNLAVDTDALQQAMGGQVAQLGQIYPESVPGHVDGKRSYVHNVEKAKRLLTAAGYPGGFTTTLYAPNADPFPHVAEAVRAQLAEAGIVAEVGLVDWASYWDWIVMKGSGAGIGLADWHGDYPDPEDWIAPLFSRARYGGTDLSFWEDARVDALLAASDRERDPARRTALFERMQDIVLDEAPSAPLYQPVWHGLRGEDVGGYYYHPLWQLQLQEMWKLDGR
jgi:oligopeptide transport system substrate-binding protein